MEYNDTINAAIYRTSAIFRKYQSLGNILSPQKFREEYYKSDFKSDFIEFFKQGIEELKSTFEPGTIRAYRQTWNKLFQFRKSIMFSDLNNDLIEKFDRYLKVKLELGTNTIAGHHKRIKKFIGIAKRKGIKIPNPYETVKSSFISGKLIYLTEDELSRMKQLYESGTLYNGYQNVARYFLFACYTGLRISDVQRITSENIVSESLVFVPYKTRRFNKQLVVPLINYPKKLIDESKGDLFETLCDQQTNRTLKYLADASDIKKNISFHVARHTFATLFLEKGGKVETLQKLLGHAKITDTMKYVHIVDKRKEEQMQLLNSLK